VKITAHDETGLQAT